MKSPIIISYITESQNGHHYRKYFVFNKNEGTFDREKAFQILTPGNLYASKWGVLLPTLGNVRSHRNFPSLDFDTWRIGHKIERLFLY